MTGQREVMRYSESDFQRVETVKFQHILDLACLFLEREGLWVKNPDWFSSQRIAQQNHCGDGHVGATIGWRFTGS